MAAWSVEITNLDSGETEPLTIANGETEEPVLSIAGQRYSLDPTAIFRLRAALGQVTPD